MMGNCREGCMRRMPLEWMHAQLLLRHGGSKSTADLDPLAVDMWAPGVDGGMAAAPTTSVRRCALTSLHIQSHELVWHFKLNKA